MLKTARNYELLCWLMLLVVVVVNETNELEKRVSAQDGVEL